MKLVIHPPVEPERLARITDAAGAMTVVNAATEAEALAHMPDADAFFGKITPPLLAAARRLRWVQAPTASLEHYLFPELTAHPCVLTNMRGLFSDVIADQVMGYILCFARNLHRYILQQAPGRWAPVGGEEDRVALRHGAGRRQRHRPRPPASGRLHARRRRPGQHRRGDRPPRPGVRHARAGRRSGANRGAARRGVASGGRSACRTCWAKAISW